MHIGRVIETFLAWNRRRRSVIPASRRDVNSAGRRFCWRRPAVFNDDLLPDATGRLLAGVETFDLDAAQPTSIAR